MSWSSFLERVLLFLGNDIYCTGEAGIDVRKQADPLIQVGRPSNGSAAGMNSTCNPITFIIRPLSRGLFDDLIESCLLYSLSNLVSSPQYNRIHHSKRSGVVVLGSGRGTIKMNDIYQNREAGIYVLYKGDPYIRLLLRKNWTLELVVRIINQQNGSYDFTVMWWPFYSSVAVGTEFVTAPLLGLQSLRVEKDILLVRNGKCSKEALPWLVIQKRQFCSLCLCLQTTWSVETDGEALTSVTAGIRASRVISSATECLMAS